MEAIGVREPNKLFELSSLVEDERISLSEAVSALSFALDLTEDAVQDMLSAVALLGMRIGTALGLADEQLCDLYYALLFERHWLQQ